MNIENVKSNSVHDKLKNDLHAINTFIEHVSEKHGLSFHEIFELLGKKREKENIIKIPSFILRERLGILESIVKYLKEELKLSYHNIAVLLNRDDRVIWATYNNAVKKKKEKFVVKEPNYWLPVSIFTDKSLGLLESITKYFKDEAGFGFSEIANLLGRDNRTIWASYDCAKKKGVRNAH